MGQLWPGDREPQPSLVHHDRPRATYAGTQVCASDFLPGAHQGTLVVRAPSRGQRGPAGRPGSPEPGAGRGSAASTAATSCRTVTTPSSPRFRSFETAFGMQTAVPDVFDLSGESAATLRLYGLERGQTTGFGWQCLTARRLVERGVRFVELIDTGSSGNWDSHGDMMDHARLALNVDRPIAGLLRDLKQRGLLDDTLVVWATEFGRTPFNNRADARGREHHNWAFSTWLAGAGVKGGTVYGSTDEHGIRVATDPVHVHDFHATILHLMGLDHTRLTYRHSGRDYRLTDVAGKVVKGLLA
ncbi:MAG: DUF1501 domain-containing protein [Isosphaeraceae bacterium]